MSDDAGDNDYTSREGQKDDPVPVQQDEDRVDEGVDAGTADSDEQLVKDDNDAIDESNIIEDRTRGAKPEAGSYSEPGEEDLPTQES